MKNFIRVCCLYGLACLVGCTTYLGYRDVDSEEEKRSVVDEQILGYEMSFDDNGIHVKRRVRKEIEISVREEREWLCRKFSTTETILNGMFLWPIFICLSVLTPISVPLSYFNNETDTLHFIDNDYYVSTSRTLWAAHTPFCNIATDEIKKGNLEYKYIERETLCEKKVVRRNVEIDVDDVTTQIGDFYLVDPTNCGRAKVSIEVTREALSRQVFKYAFPEQKRTFLLSNDVAQCEVELPSELAVSENEREAWRELIAASRRMTTDADATLAGSTISTASIDELERRLLAVDKLRGEVKGMTDFVSSNGLAEVEARLIKLRSAYVHKREVTATQLKKIREEERVAAEIKAKREREIAEELARKAAERKQVLTMEFEAMVLRANGGDVKAQFSLYNVLREGNEAVGKDEKDAIKWLLRARDGGYKPAQKEWAEIQWREFKSKKR